jgi:hypothetical protein
MKREPRYKNLKNLGQNLGQPPVKNIMMIMYSAVLSTVCPETASSMLCGVHRSGRRLHSGMQRRETTRGLLRRRYR